MNHAILAAMPKAQLKHFLLESDRVHFARPVPVLVHCGPARKSEQGTIVCFDPAKGRTFTTSRKLVVVL